jgi:hypothetical protein
MSIWLLWLQCERMEPGKSVTMNQESGCFLDETRLDHPIRLITSVKQICNTRSSSIDIKANMLQFRLIFRTTGGTSGMPT